MATDEHVVRFEEVSFEYGHNKPILISASFALRRGAKFALMGQNGAGKTTLFTLLTGERAPDSGAIHVMHGMTVATAAQALSKEDLALSVREYFQKCFPTKVYDIDPKIDEVLETVNLKVPHDRLMSQFSGGQQARLLLASALIKKPDLLLLDEPTNNLDAAGIEHLTQFLLEYPKTCLVISHDAEFLNAFTAGVLYLDIFKHIVEQYKGTYHDVVREIEARILKEQRANAQLEKQIAAKYEQANKWANKAGPAIRKIAKQLRERAEELEEEKVEVRKENKTIRPFIIPVQARVPGTVFTLSSYSVMKGKKMVKRKAHVRLARGMHLRLEGPNGIGKTTLLESIVNGTNPDAKITDGVKVGYYRQDFSAFNFDETPYQALTRALGKVDEERVRSVAASLLITSDIVTKPIGTLSEGQKGLVALAALILIRPGLLILDEPTNHINFRHLPVIARALNSYEGAMILVSHASDFVAQLRIDDTLDLGK